MSREDSETAIQHFDYGYGQRVDDVDVELYEMSQMVASDAVPRAKKMYAEEHGVRHSKLVGRKLYRRTAAHRESRTYVVVSERGDLR